MRNTAIGATVGIAGCSQTDSSESNTPNNNETTDEADQPINQRESDMPHPDERNYDSINYDIELPEHIDSTLARMEEEIDTTFYENLQRKEGVLPRSLKRSESYLSVEDRGTETFELEDGNQETMEADLYGLELDVDIEDNISEEKALRTAGVTMSAILELTGQSFYWEEKDFPFIGEESGFSKFSLNVNAENGTGNVTYSVEEDEGEPISEYFDMTENYSETDDAEAFLNNLEEDFTFN